MLIIKSINSIYCFGILILLQIGCSSTSNKKINIDAKLALMNKSAIIAGRITHKDVYPNLKEVKLTIPDFDGNKTVLISKLNEKGEYKFEIFPKTKREISLVPIANTLVISPGDSLFILKDLNDIGNVICSGSCGHFNSEICNFGKLFLGGFRSDYLPSYEEFLLTCKTEKAGYFDKLKELRKTQELSDEFCSWITTKIELEYAKELIDFKIQHWKRTKEKLKDSLQYYAFTDKIQYFFNNSIVVTDNFEVSGELLSPTLPKMKLICEKYAKEIINRDTTVLDLMTKDLINQTDTSYASQFLLASFLGRSLDLNNPSTFDQNWEVVSQKITDPFLMRTLTDYYDRVMEHNRNPKKNSDALRGISDDIEHNSRIGIKKQDETSLLNKIIDSKPNKVIYIDIWATWCPACLVNMPFSIQLMKDYSTKDIEFVFINVIDNKENWQKEINKLGIGGTQIYCNELEAREIRKTFNFPGIPYYLLINKKGVIIDYGYHLVPQGKWTVSKIDRLLKE